MKAISNENLQNIGGSSYVAGFAPGATYSYDAGEPDITITNTTTLPAGYAIAAMHVNVTDKNGKSLYLKITDGASHSIAVNTLDPFEGFNVLVSYVSTEVDGITLQANMAIYNVGYGTPATGTLRYINKQHC